MSTPGTSEAKQSREEKVTEFKSLMDGYEKAFTQALEISPGNRYLKLYLAQIQHLLKTEPIFKTQKLDEMDSKEFLDSTAHTKYILKNISESSGAILKNIAKTEDQRQQFAKEPGQASTEQSTTPTPRPR